MKVTGVEGLEKFMHNNPGCCEPVNIEELALAYMMKHQKNPELIFDVGYLIYVQSYMYKQSLSGSQMKELAYLLEMFLMKLQSFGIKVTAFISGIVNPYKQRLILNSQKSKRSKVSRMFESLRSNIEVKKSPKFFPNNMRRVVIDTFKKCKCQIFQSLIQCNIEAANYSMKNNCFGILAQDSNFVIYNAAEYFFSLKYLNMETFNTLCYRTDKLTEILDLSPIQLPLLSTVIGNTIVYHWTLKKFHQSLFENNEKFSRGEIFHKAVAFLKKNVQYNHDLSRELPKLSQKLFGSHNKSHLLQESLESYKIDVTPKDDFANTNDEKWNRLQKIIIEKHKAAIIPYNVYQIVFHSMYFQRVDMEDYEKENYQLWCYIAQKLRRKIYGILLINKPYVNGRSESIKEIHISKMDEQRNNVKPIYPKIKVDLLELWSAEVDEDKWNLFCYSLGIKKEILSVLDRHLIIPVASLNYLMIESFKIASWELEAVLASVLLLQYYSIEDLNEIPQHPLNPDGVHLYWYLMKIFDFVAILNSVCGFPLESDLASPVHYQDGKLFHLKYREAKENVSFENLCELREKEIKAGRKIMDMFY